MDNTSLPNRQRAQTTDSSVTDENIARHDHVSSSTTANNGSRVSSGTVGPTVPGEYEPSVTNTSVATGPLEATPSEAGSQAVAANY